jgi:hypothetical protein
VQRPALRFSSVLLTYSDRRNPFSVDSQ